MTGNLALTLANVAAQDAERHWKNHKGGCPRCSVASRQRRPLDMCERGRQLYADRADCASDLARERRLAKQPNPNQFALFGPEEIT